MSDELKLSEQLQMQADHLKSIAAELVYPDNTAIKQISFTYADKAVIFIPATRDLAVPYKDVAALLAQKVTADANTVQAAADAQKAIEDAANQTQSTDLNIQENVS